MMISNMLAALLELDWSSSSARSSSACYRSKPHPEFPAKRLQIGSKLFNP